jgi:hypothetical protein
LPRSSPTHERVVGLGLLFNELPLGLEPSHPSQVFDAIPHQAHDAEGEEKHTDDDEGLHHHQWATRALGNHSKSEGEVRHEAPPCGFQSDDRDRVVEVWLSEHGVLDPGVLGPTGEVQEALLVGDLKYDQVVALEVPVASDDRVVYHEGNGAMDCLGGLGSRWEVRADDDVEFVSRGHFSCLGLTINGSIA